MIKIVFWSLVALDVLGVLLFFALGLAGTSSSRSSPLQVALVMFVLPSIPLLLAILLFVRSSGAVGRILAVLIVGSPLLITVAARAVAVAKFRMSTNEEGEMTFFRSGPMREIAEAIARNDSTTVASLVKTVNVNHKGSARMTLLGLAMRQLRKTPEQQVVLRLLLDAGADPNEPAQQELPLGVALQVADKTGPGPVKLLLDAGANPNLTNSFGAPVYFAAMGQSANIETLTMLLERGAEMNFVSRIGETALFAAARTRNWNAALFLLQRGADWKLGKSVNGLPFENLIDSYVGTEGGDGAFVAVRQHLQRR